MTGRRVPIGTVASRYGVPATTLRYWEDLGLLPPQERSGGQRRYDPDALRRVMLTLPPIDWCTD
jgi:MerR family redox-sensitive transcriptional activator SoxR